MVNPPMIKANKILSLLLLLALFVAQLVHAQEEEEASQEEILAVVRAQAAGAAGGIIFIAAGAGKDVDFIADLARQLTDILATEIALQGAVLDVPRELLIAATIQGAVEGAVASATLAGMDAAAIAKIKAAAGNVSEPVVAMLGDLSLEDILNNVDPTVLIAEVTETGITDADIAALGEGMEEVSLNVFISDRDGDGLADATENKIGSDPDNPDSDGDLLTDGVEYHIFACDPQSPDSDGDGVSDSVEVGLGTEPLIAEAFGIDSDRDAIPDDYEARLGTNPEQADSDGDGWHDGFELGVGSDPLVKDVQIAETGFTVSPLSPGDPHAWLFLGNPPE
ncbi:MAG: hypothetical protein HOK49_08630 [Opitutae bacterium]|nr:hypothetical protein [Opitutae bacterium]